MNQSALFQEPHAPVAASRAADTHLSGWRLVAARYVCIALMLLFCGLYLIALFVYYGPPRTPSGRVERYCTGSLAS
jgi:hypothetical protein